MIAHLITATSIASMAIAGALLLRQRSAGLRHAILFAALLAFAIPTPWLSRAGSWLATCLTVKVTIPSFLDFEAPLAAASLPAMPAKSRGGSAALPVMEIAWAAGFVLLVCAWLRGLLRVVPGVRETSAAEAAALRRGLESSRVKARVELCITGADRVPGARGWLRSSVVLPDGLSEHLTEAELDAVIAHELAHIARRDNLSAAVARLIASAFWFHPLVWWIERRMLVEREAACDEMVLARGAERGDYISAISKVCRMYLMGARGYAGATGSNLQSRMEQIMTARIDRPSPRWLRGVPAAILGVAALLPAAGGFLRGQVAAPASQAHRNSANDATLARALECYKQGQFPQAEELFRQVFLSDPQDLRGVTGLSETYLSENRPEEAVKLVRQQADENPGARDLTVFLANVYVRIDQYDLAIAELKSALNSAPQEEKAELQFRIGEANRRKGDLNEAMRWFQAASASNPKEVQPLLSLALILDGTGRADQAVPVYEKILKLQPDHPVALNNLAYIVTQKGDDPGRALELAKKAAELQKTSADIQDTLGWAHLKDNHAEEAAAAFRTALKAEPQNATFHYHLGMALLQLGQRDAAAGELQTALADHLNQPDETQVRELLGKIAP